jgi:hypothetical protein
VMPVMTSFLLRNRDEPVVHWSRSSARDQPPRRLSRFADEIRQLLFCR